MQQRVVSLEMKVGAFIISGMVMLVVFLFAIGDLATYFQPGLTLHVVFDAANGIARGSPVQYAGVEVGKVEDVRIIYPSDPSRPKVELIARVPRRLQIRTDDIAAISTFGLLGEKYLEIIPGAGTGALVKATDLLIGRPPVSTEQVIQRSNEVLTEFKRALEGLNALVGDPEARIYLKEALQEARDATRQWRLLGERLNVAMYHAEGGEGNLGKLLFDEDLYQRIVLFVDDLREHPWKLLIRPKGQKTEDRRQKTGTQ